MFRVFNYYLYKQIFLIIYIFNIITNMPPKKLKKFCRLTKYLEVMDKELHQAIDDLCLFSLFRARGGRGITLLYPSEKTYRKKIIDYTYSDAPEKAITMIKALVLSDYLPNPIDFNNKKDDIPNASNEKLVVKSADAKTVTLEGGFKLTPATDYKPSRDGDKIAVYKLSGKGELPASGVRATMKYTQMNSSKPTRGGNDLNPRILLSKFVEKTYISNDTGAKNVYKFVLNGLFRSILDDQDIETKQEITKLVYSGLCASARATFYTIVSPYNTTNKYDSLNKYIQIMLKADLGRAWGLYHNSININYNKSLEWILKEARPGGYNYSLERKKIEIIQKDLLGTVKDANTCISAIKEAYEKDTSKNLSKDLITVYCYLSSCVEADSPGDNTYYNNCFLYAMKNIFNDPKNILKTHTDTANNLTLYGNLLKSDAFLFVPNMHYDIESTDKDIYKVYENELPSPLTVGMFTITRSEKMHKVGGGNDDMHKLFGGDSLSHSTEIQTGM